MATVLIADDHPLIRLGLRQLLSVEPSVKIIEECGTGLAVLKQLRSRRWDLLILDIQLPDRNGIDVLKDVVAHHPDTKVIMVSGLPSRQYEMDTLRSGAAGYVDKEKAPDELVDVVRLVLQGRKYVSPSMLSVLHGIKAADRDKLPHERLSERELQIFLRLASGKPASDIASELNLSVKSVSTYRIRVLEKMNLEINAELTSYAVRNNLIPP